MVNINILKGCLKEGRERLHGLTESRIAQYIHSVPENFNNVTESMFPAIAALGYAVSMLNKYPPDPEYDYYVDRYHGSNLPTGY